MEKVIQFLRDLASHNNREWFNDNKKRYEESRDKVLFLTEVLINEIRKFDREIPALDPKDCMFRIYRDVRFSKDKSPYKTQFGSYIAKGGRKSILPGYYIHIEPDGSFAGGGIYMPPSDVLAAIRSHIAEQGTEFKTIISDPDFIKYFPSLYNDKLKTAPKNFPQDHEFIQYLSYKSYVFSAPVNNDLFSNDKYIDFIVQAFRQLHKLNLFLYESLDIK